MAKKSIAALIKYLIISNNQWYEYYFFLLRSLVTPILNGATEAIVLRFLRELQTGRIPWLYVQKTSF